ncbi:MAG: hypothetical protein IKP40_10640 [Clostridia bacterium]|nr:hypothetical protein [Clostridia bacterium]
MDKMVPKDKLSKKEKKRLAAEGRAVWGFPPVTRRVESKKLYNRKKISRIREDSGREICFCLTLQSAGAAPC